MAAIARDFMVWLVCFGGASVLGLIAAHVAMRRYRNSDAADRSRRKTRAAFIPVVIGLYAIAFGPITIDLVKYLSQPAPDDMAETHVSAVSRPSDELSPVPDPISTY